MLWEQTFGLPQLFCVDPSQKQPCAVAGSGRFEESLEAWGLTSHAQNRYPALQGINVQASVTTMRSA